MNRKTIHLAVTALAVAQALGFPQTGFAAFANAETVETLQERLLDLRNQANNIQARADAEQRELSADEDKEVSQLFAAFETTEADIARRERLAEINNKMAAPAGRKTNADVADAGDQTTRAQAERQEKPRAYAQPRSADAGKWGFRSAGEFMVAVVRGSAKGGVLDPRLIANATPTTFGSEGVGADGGYAVPPDFRNVIVQKIMGEDSLLSLTDQQTATGNNITFPADETSPWQSSGGIQAYWEGEGLPLQQSKPALTEKQIKLSKVTALVPVTEELREDAAAMSGYVNRKAPEKMNFKVNDAIFNGSGVGMPLGILVSPGTVIVPKEAGQVADTVMAENILKLWTSVTPSARKNARWFLNPDVEAQLPLLKFPGSGGNASPVPLYMPPGGMSQAPYGTLLGRPIHYTEAAKPLGDKGDIVFGDLANYLSAVKSGGIRAEVSIHLWFDHDIAAFKFVLRVGGQPWWNQPIQGFHAGTQPRGFFATLAERA